MTKPLTPEEEALAALLERASLPRPQARAFAALARGSGHAALDLAAATGLSRQSAADAGNALELAGLARVESVASGGRPIRRYHLAGAGLAALLATRRAALARELAALDEMEARFS
ncbi:MAG TPA: helix-turn-helix domain-containing protein [Candidatus Thermoplasmatota archaeon]|nr:helix-turn-helix domain-containing protein [Candidatus Thermoplasmatota archaeon]